MLQKRSTPGYARKLGIRKIFPLLYSESYKMILMRSYRRSSPVPCQYYGLNWKNLPGLHHGTLPGRYCVDAGDFNKIDMVVDRTAAGIRTCTSSFQNRRRGIKYGHKSGVPEGGGGELILYYSDTGCTGFQTQDCHVYVRRDYRGGSASHGLRITLFHVLPP